MTEADIVKLVTDLMRKDDEAQEAPSPPKDEEQ